MSNMQVVVDDTLINYSDTGKGPILVCVHGWMHDKSSYSQLTAELDGRYRIIALDLPNFGTSQLNEKVESVAQYAQFLAAFLQKLTISSYTLVGHSMGCQISMYGVGMGILTPQKLILIAPAGVRNDRTTYKKSLKYVSKIVKHVVPKSYKKKFYVAIGSDYDPDMSPIHKSIITKTLNTDVQAEAKTIHTPTLIINGTLDRNTPIWMAETLAREIRGATLEAVPQEAHHLHQKSPALVAGIIRKFLV